MWRRASLLYSTDDSRSPETRRTIEKNLINSAKIGMTKGYRAKADACVMQYVSQECLKTAVRLQVERWAN